MKKAMLGMLLAILSSSILFSAFSFQSVKAAGTVYINADGSISPPEAPISSLDNITYTLTDNVYDSIVIERSNMVVDGKSYTLQGDGAGNGFTIQDVVNVTILDTKITGCIEGIQLFNSLNIIITNNDIAESSYEGVGIYFSFDNVISGNNITNNQVGIAVYNSSSDLVFHNRFASNTYQAYTEFSITDWDNGYPSGGNYWTDHTGPDNYRGPSQNQPNSDGICDTAYVIDVSNQDNYPLTKLYGGVHDIGIAKFSATKTVITQNYNPNITTKAINYGINSETFNIKVSVNESSVTQTQITLMSRDSVILTFIWNTTDLPKAKYNFTAIASPVPGETDTSDNTRESWIVITVQGDINGDGTVNILDSITMGKSFFATPIAPNWNPNADLNNDNIVNILDAIIVAINFGRTST